MNNEKNENQNGDDLMAGLAQHLGGKLKNVWVGLPSEGERQELQLKRDQSELERMKRREKWAATRLDALKKAAFENLRRSQRG